MITREDVPVNLTLIGNEMLGCTDAENRVPGGPALERLVADLTPPLARVLLAGPHDDGLVEAALARGAEVTCLLRAYVDAFAVATAYPQVRVMAGSLTKLDPSQRYDVVIAADGCWRLCSADGPQLDWQECLDRLRGILAPAGRLVLAVANPLGLDRLVEMPVLTQPTADESAPASVADILALDVAGANIYCAYPTSTAPLVLIPTQVLDDARAASTAPTLAALVADACAREFAGRAVLSDPRRLATTAVRGDAAATLAASWIVVATPGLTESPAAIIADRPGAPGFDVRYELTGAGASMIRKPDPSPIYRCDGLQRDSTRLAAPIPSGRFLHHLLAATAASGNGPAMRQALHGYATWLETLDDPIFAAPANVVTDGDSYALFDPSWSWHRPVPPIVALTRALREVAADLVAGGAHHPWPATTDVDELTLTLAAAAGRPTDRATVAAAVELEEAVRSALGGKRESGATGVDDTGYRELVVALRRERDEVEHLRAMIAWYGYLLDDRERTLAHSERMVAMFSGSLRYRTYRIVTAPARRARRAVRSVGARLKRGS